MPELIVTLKLPNEVKQALRAFADAFKAKFPHSTGLMNSAHNINVDSYPITCMVWNVQGAGSREFMNVLREIVRTNKPVVLTLVETHMGGEHAQRIATVLGYEGHTRVDAQGFSGGIWVYWKTALVTIDPIAQSGQYITMEITKTGERPWYFSAIYASPDPSNRHELWRELSDFARNNDKPWLLAGDFNDTRYGWERSSACADTIRRSERFNHWVESSQLLEVEFAGSAHTWS